MAEPNIPIVSGQTPMRGENTVFVLGVLSIVFALVFVWAGLILGIIGVVKGRKLLRYAREHNLPQPSSGYAGYVCSVVGLVLSAVILVVGCILMILLVLVFAIFCGDPIHSSSGVHIQWLIPLGCLWSFVGAEELKKNGYEVRFAEDKAKSQMIII